MVKPRRSRPAYALVANVDLVVVRYGDEVSVLFGRCLHRGALLADGSVDGDNLICGLHNWDYRIQTGISEYNNHEVLRKFKSWVEDGELFVDRGRNRRLGKAAPAAVQAR